MTSMTRHPKHWKIGWLDVVVTCAVLGAVSYITYRAVGVLRYDWNWGEIPQYFFRYDEVEERWVSNLLIQGFLTTARLAIWAAVLASVIGLGMGLCRVSDILFLRLIARAYVELVRNLPPLVFIFIFYFFISSQLTPLLGLDDFARNASPTSLMVVKVLFSEPKLFSNYMAGLFCLALFEGAYFVEIIRAGIQSVPKEQWQAGESMGLTRLQVVRYVVLPQALRNIVPPLAVQFITLIKDSAIVSLISIQELTFLAMEIAISTTRFFELLITLALLYFVICYSCALAFDRLEKRMAKGRQ